MTIRDLIPWKKKSNGGELRRPLEDLRGWAETMDRAFDDFWAPMRFGGFGSSLFKGLQGWSPEVDVKETANEILISASLPGVDKKDIHVNLTEDRLTIRGERKSEKEEKDKDGRVRREQSYGSFSRSFTLPAAVKADKAKAEYKDGVLRLKLPKVKESKARRIEID